MTKSNLTNNNLQFNYGGVNFDSFPKSKRAELFLPKTFEWFGVPVAVLGNRACVDSVSFRQRLFDYSGDIFGFWSKDKNIYIRVFRVFANWFLEVRIYSLTKFYKKRSSAIISDYNDALNSLNIKINNELKSRKNRICFDCYECEIIREDTFGDIRFLNRRKSEMKDFFEQAKQITITDLPMTTDYPFTHYWHNGINLENSTEFLKLYFKENHKPRLSGDELNKYKLRWEHSLQNKGKSKILDETVKQFNLPQSQFVEVGNKTFQYQNNFKSNVFSLLNQTAINTIFEHRIASVFSLKKYLTN